MSGFWGVCKREFFSLFVTPTAWVLIVVFLVLQGFHFYGLVHHFAEGVEPSVDDGPVQAFFGGSIFFFIPLVLLCPGMTMDCSRKSEGAAPSRCCSRRRWAPRAWCSESSSRRWLPTWPCGPDLALFGGAEPRVRYRLAVVVGTSYMGVALIGASYLAIGTLMSALTDNQLTALVLSSLIILSLFLLGIGEMVFDAGPLQDFCAYVSVWGQMAELSKGIVDSRRLVFDLTLVTVPLFVCVRAVDAWRWG